MNSPIPPLVACYHVSTEEGLRLNAQQSAVPAPVAGGKLLGKRPAFDV